MIREQKKIDLYSVLFSTSMQKERLEKYIRCVNDTERDKRFEVQECMICFYVDPRIGGAATTNANCSGCDKIMGFGSTCVDKLCIPCAKKLKLCKHCGADINYKNRRKL